MKFHNLRILFLILMVVTVVFMGCSEDDDEDGDELAGDLTSVGALGDVVVLSWKITEDTKLTANYKYLLRGGVFVELGATLDIEAGTTIYGEGASNGTLIISKGGKIEANGTASKPIIMTCDQAPGSRARGQWGGLIVNGSAPINVGAEAFGEGDTGSYGGTNPADSSGTLKYVRIEFAGIEFSPDNELNGIAFQGVGSGTVVDYVQVHFNQDDGIEFFGGTVNAKHLVCSGIRDDSFDWTYGWTGKGQYWIAQQRGDDADQGFEIDNNSKNNEATPRSDAQIYNVTLVGDPKGKESDIGMLVREGAAGTYKNIIAMGFRKTGLRIDGDVSQRMAAEGKTIIQTCIFFGNTSEGAEKQFHSDFEKNMALDAANSNRVVDPELGAPYDLTAPNFTPAAGSPALVGAATPPSDGFFDKTNFVGAMGAGDNWIAGWTNFAQN